VWYFHTFISPSSFKTVLVALARPVIDNLASLWGTAIKVLMAGPLEGQKMAFWAQTAI